MTTRLTLAALLVLGINLIAQPARAQSVDELAALNAELAQSVKVRKYSEAISIAQRALALAERSSDQLNVANLLTTLAEIYQLQGRFAEGAPLAERALDIFTKIVSEKDPAVLAGLHLVAQLQFAANRIDEAIATGRRELNIREELQGKRRSRLIRFPHRLGVYVSNGRASGRR